MKPIFLVLTLVSVLAVSQDSGLIAELEKGGTLAAGSSGTMAVYDELIKKGFENRQGHTMAAALMATCRPTEAVDVIVNDFYLVLRGMGTSKHPVISRAQPRQDAPISYTAAILTCKKGARTPEEMARLLDVAYSAVVGDGLLNWQPNVVVAALLVSPEAVAVEAATPAQTPETLPTPAAVPTPPTPQPPTSTAIPN